METLLSMPMPMFSSLMVMAVIAAFLFIKLLALLVLPIYSRQEQDAGERVPDQRAKRAAAPAQRSGHGSKAPDARSMRRRGEAGERYISAC